MPHARRFWLSAIATAAIALPTLAFAQTKIGRDPHRPRLQQDRPAGGLRQADRHRLRMMGLDYATGGTMSVAGRSWS